MSVKYGSNKHEEIYGLGLQYTEWNHKGKQVHIISSEGGIGRGLKPITKILNAVGAGGSETTTYTASYSHLTN